MSCCCWLDVVQVLCTTGTLAMGVNLPAHLVVLKGTVRWVGDTDVLPGEQPGYKEYSQTEVRHTCMAPLLKKSLSKSRCIMLHICAEHAPACSCIFSIQIGEMHSSVIENT